MQRITPPPCTNLPALPAAGAAQASEGVPLCPNSVESGHECTACRCETGSRARIAAGCLFVLLLLVIGAGAQDKDGDSADEEKDKPKQVPLSLLERDPFYQMTLDAENDNAVLDILPVKDIPTDPKPTDRLRIRLVDDPDQLYQVLWQHIVKVRTYDQLVFEESQKLIREKKYNEAFPYLDYVIKHSPSTPALRRSILEYLINNAAALADEGHYEHALAILEELTRRDKTYRQAEVATRIARVADKLIANDVAKGDYRQARGFIDRLSKEYGPTRIESLVRWRQKLIQQATDLKRRAEQKIAAGEFREAERLSRQLANVWPQLPGARELSLDIAKKYPMVIVGVAEKAGRQDVTSIDSWSARRTGRLTQRTLLEFIGAGPEGGQYLCSLGEYTQSDDRRQLTVELNPLARTGAGARVDGYDVSRAILELANPASPKYQTAWASLVQGVSVEDVFKVHIDLRRPHVLPEAMLQIRLDSKKGQPPGGSPSDGPYLPASGDDGQDHFVLNRQFPLTETELPSEIVERYFDSSQDAISALRRGDIDAIDYLFPDDAAHMQNDERLNVVAYALPTIHVLVPNYNNQFTANQTFRRALVYGINRQAILDGELLGNNEITGCRVISGPFPIGTRDNDPLAYAYDDRIKPRSYYPRLAAILKTLARRALKEMAKKRDLEVPKETKLVLGFPGNEVARVSCQAIAQYLQVIGIECELRELPPGMNDDPSGEVDLLYVQVAMWEPVIDARRLLAPAGVSDMGNEYVGMALRRLDTAKNWREVRERLHELHRIVHEQVAVIPLWQTVNYLVYNQRLRGVGPRPLTLYQDVEQWRVTPRGIEIKK